MIVERRLQWKILISSTLYKLAARPVKTSKKRGKSTVREWMWVWMWMWVVITRSRRSSIEKTWCLFTGLHSTVSIKTVMFGFSRSFTIQKNGCLQTIKRCLVNVMGEEINPKQRAFSHSRVAVSFHSYRVLLRLNARGLDAVSDIGLRDVKDLNRGYNLSRSSRSFDYWWPQKRRVVQMGRHGNRPRRYRKGKMCCALRISRFLPNFNFNK